jgi:hypothetical protein
MRRAVRIIEFAGMDATGGQAFAHEIFLLRI